MYKATKQWQPNRYMERLVKDGIVYFLVCVSISPSFSFSICHRHILHPSCSRVFAGKLTARLFASEPLGTSSSIFLV